MIDLEMEAPSGARLQPRKATQGDAMEMDGRFGEGEGAGEELREILHVTVGVGAVLERLKNVL